MWHRQHKHHSVKIAIDLSHYRLLERLESSNRSAVILEDDAQLTGERWLHDLLTVLQELPKVRNSWSCQRYGLGASFALASLVHNSNSLLLTSNSILELTLSRMGASTTKLSLLPLRGGGLLPTWRMQYQPQLL
jgi:hypothetical protein